VLRRLSSVENRCRKPHFPQRPYGGTSKINPIFLMQLPAAHPALRSQFKNPKILKIRFWGFFFRPFGLGLKNKEGKIKKVRVYAGCGVS